MDHRQGPDRGPPAWPKPWSQERAVTHRGASEQLTGRGHEARASGPGWVAMARGGVGDRGVRRGCIVVGRFGQGAINDQRVDDTYTAAAPDFAKLRAAPPRRSDAGAFSPGTTVWRTTGTSTGSCGPCSARAISLTDPFAEWTRFRPAAPAPTSREPPALPVRRATARPRWASSRFPNSRHVRRSRRVRARVRLVGVKGREPSRPRGVPAPRLRRFRQKRRDLPPRACARRGWPRHASRRRPTARGVPVRCARLRRRHDL